MISSVNSQAHVHQAAQTGNVQGGNNAATFLKQLEGLQKNLQEAKYEYYNATGSDAKNQAQETYDKYQDIYQNYQNEASEEAFNNPEVEQQMRNTQADFAQFQAIINRIPIDNRPWDDPKERQRYKYSLTAMAKYLQQKVNEFSPDTQVGKDARADLAAVQSDLREMQLEDKSGNFNDGEKEATFQESYHDYWTAQKEFGDPPYSGNKTSISRMVATRQLI